MENKHAGFGSLFRSRLFLIMAVVYLAVGAALVFVPLTDYLGLEFSLVVGIIAGFAGGPLAIAFFQRRIKADDVLARTEWAQQIGASSLWGETILFHSGAALFALIGLGVAALFREPCAPFRGVGFFALLPLVSIAYSSAWGLATIGLLHRPRLAKILVVLFALATLAGSLLEFIDQPAVWVYNPFFGHFPGPIYDEAVTPSLALTAYRLGNLATAWLVVLLVGGFWHWRLRRHGKPARVKASTVFLFVLLLLTTIGIDRGGYALGFRVDDKHLQNKLGGHIATEHFDIYYPRRSDIERQIHQIAVDHEFRYAQIEREFGMRYPHRITSWVYPDEATKKKWIGAGGTEYADCAKHQMHLNFEDFPIGILHHEMIHVMLSEYGLPVFGFSAKITVTEGIAVHFGGPIRWRQSVDRWAAGMKAIDRLPKISKIMGLGFWAISGARSYTAAGSFIGYLVQQPDGLRKVLAAYKWGDLENYFGKPIAELEKDWLKYLTAIEATLTPAEIERARYRFGFKSIFEMRCPREVGRLLSEADRNEDKHYYHKADLLYRKASVLDRNNVRIARKRISPLLRTGQLELAEQLANDISVAQGTSSQPALDRKGRIVGSQLIAQRAEIIIAALAWGRGENDKAQEIYRRIHQADLHDSLTREAACALYALDHPEVEPYLRPYLTSFTNKSSAYWTLIEGLAHHPEDPVILYLTSRRMLSNEAYAHVLQTLPKALSAGLPDEKLILEAWFSLGYAAFMEGNLDQAEQAFLKTRTILNDDQLTGINDWIDRCRSWHRLEKMVAEQPMDL